MAQRVQHQSYDQEILRSLRRIIRAIDLYSRDLKARHGLTIPQLLCLSTIIGHEKMTAVNVARAIHLSPTTLVGILDRLEKEGYIERQRSRDDRRNIMLTATSRGKEVAKAAPPPLQKNLVKGLSRLSVSEQTKIADSLQTIVRLMEADQVSAAPILTLERKSFAVTSGKKERRGTKAV